MTHDEIIEMARQAGWQYAHGESGYEPLWAFAKLVAQHEREACAYRAGIALLGADRGLANRVDQAIRVKNAA
jgi:hypothetical protein